MRDNVVGELLAACDSAEIPVYGEDFLCRTLAILYCYGGGPGSEHFRAPIGHAVAMKAMAMLEDAVACRKWEIVEKYRSYVRALQTDNAPWLERTLDKLNIPASEIRLCECVDLAANVPCRTPGRMPCKDGCRKQCRDNV